MDSLISLLDVTLLEEHVDEHAIKIWCNRIRSLKTSPAAICTYLHNIETIQKHLSVYAIPITTVINFPHGLYEAEDIQSEIRQALSLGVSELDIVIPYGKWLQKKDPLMIIDFILQCRSWAGDKIILKFILETGAIQLMEDIGVLTELLCQYGAHFVKTSTGKMVPGATDMAVETIAAVVKQHYDLTTHKVGIKVAGGVRTLEQANHYVHIVREHLGDAWIEPRYLRLGVSRLLDEIIKNRCSR